MRIVVLGGCEELLEPDPFFAQLEKREIRIHEWHE
jgi:hypothetical protein